MPVSHSACHAVGLPRGAVADAIDRNLQVRPLPTVYVREIDDEAIVLNMETEKYIGFDPVARSMWEALTTSANIADAIDRLASEYAVERPILEADVTAFIANLQENELVRLTPVA
jgi:Coenzyme PQQ synthesis protein D (PqqD)